MPRPPSVPHVLRTARKIRGLTQEALARRVRVATITIKQIESGRIKLSRQLAHRISIVTRLDTQQLLDNSEPDSPKLHPDHWTEPPTQEEIDRETKLLSDGIKLGLLSRANTRTEFWVLRYAINQALGNLGKEFGKQIKPIRSTDVNWKEIAAKRRQPQAVSPGSGNGEKRSATRSRVPSPRPSRERA